MSMGVTVHRVEAPFQAELAAVSRYDAPASAAQDPHQNAYYLTMGSTPTRARKPKVALYEPFTANMDTGWTQYVLDQFKVAHQTIHNDDFATGELAGRFDAIILASQPVNSILHGTRSGESAGRDCSPGDRAALQRPEFTGGIGVQGLAKLESFVRQGGTLIAFDDATGVPVQFFPLPVRPLLAGVEGTSGYFSPGSLMRIQADTAHPLAAGMPTEAYAFTTGGQAWDISLLDKFNVGDREVRSVARYADSALLASGWISGERAVLGKHILLEARHGKGRVILFGFHPQFRAQTAGTFKFILNAIYSAAPEERQPGSVRFVSVSRRISRCGTGAHGYSLLRERLGTGQHATQQRHRGPGARAPLMNPWTNELMRHNEFEASDNILAVSRGELLDLRKTPGWGRRSWM